MDERTTGATRQRRWGWVAVAIGLPGAWLLAVLSWEARSGPGYPIDLYLVLGLFAAPTLLGIRMIVAARKLSPGSMNRARPMPRPALTVLLWTVGLFTAAFVMSLPSFASNGFNPHLAYPKSDLKDLASQQEIYFNEHDSYTSSMDDLAFRASAGVLVSIAASETGWTARALHSQNEKNEGCAIYFGDVGLKMSTPDGRAPTQPGEIVCDG